MQKINAQSLQLVIIKKEIAIEIKQPKKFKNEEDVLQFLKSIKQQFIYNGYLETSIDSVQHKQDSIFVWMHFGKKYLLQSNTILSKKQQQNTLNNSIYSIELNKEKTLKNLENNGHPFAKITTDSIVLTDSSLHYKSIIEKGKLIAIDSFINYGNSKLTKGFIQNYIGIKRKQFYNESSITTIDKLLQKLPYATVQKPTQILFREDKADIHLYLNKRKVNSFDFLVGFLPGSNNGKILITGEVKVHLQNSFKRGEEIYLEWKRLQKNSQNLDIRFNYPYLLNAPIGVNFTFNLDKRDSSSLDLAWQLGLPYITKSNNYIKGFYKYFQTIILATDTVFIKQTKKLPPNLDGTYNQYGIQAYYENLDYLFNPHKGFELKLTGSLGTKKIKTNNQITTLSDAQNPTYNFSNLYDSIKRRSIKGDIFWLGNYYLLMGKKQKHILKFSVNGGSVFNQNLFKNELIRIGGNKLLRGFDEQSILASTYNLTTVEYRMLVQRNSYFFLFLDAAYVRRKFNNLIYQDIPFGFGAGITFETKIGIFGLTYALGQQKYQPIDFRNSKIHFGYVAVF